MCIAPLSSSRHQLSENEAKHHEDGDNNNNNTDDDDGIGSVAEDL